MSTCQSAQLRYDVQKSAYSCFWAKIGGNVLVQQRFLSAVRAEFNNLWRRRSMEQHGTTRLCRLVSLAALCRHLYWRVYIAFTTISDEFSQWTAWGSCLSTCDGIRTKTRKCLRENDVIIQINPGCGGTIISFGKCGKNECPAEPNVEFLRKTASCWRNRLLIRFWPNREIYTFQTRRISCVKYYLSIQFGMV